MPEDATLAMHASAALISFRVLSWAYPSRFDFATPLATAAIAPQGRRRFDPRWSIGSEASG